MSIADWGNYPVIDGEMQDLLAPELASRALAGGPTIAHGMGRSYGDAALGTGHTVSTLKLNRLLALNRDALELTVEAGAVLADIIRILLPMGFFPSVVPGTQFITAGGAVAANVHGKNHHCGGGFGQSVTRLKMMTADGELVRCSAHENADLFRATIGGMGLTGIITEVTFKLIRVETGYIRQNIKVAANLDEAMQIFEASQDWTYTVAWIDGLAKGNALGRSLVYRGEHARLSDLTEKQQSDPFGSRAPLPLAVPFNMPNFTLNRLSVKAFNMAYYLNGLRHQGSAIAGWYPYYFPLDAISNWNRIYGRRGFIQYQCVIPKAKSRDALGELLEVIDHKGNPSFLAVLKLLGADDAGWMSFPMEGYTLAIDFPVSQRTMQVANELDRIVAANGGRLYLAKDARQDRTMVEAGYPNIAKFRDFRRASGARSAFRSLQSERLDL